MAVLWGWVVCCFVWFGLVWMRVTEGPHVSDNQSQSLGAQLVS